VSFLLAENQAAVDFDVKHTTFALHKFSIDAILVLDRSRQTGGLGRVISHHAVGDPDLHCKLRGAGFVGQPYYALAKRKATGGRWSAWAICTMTRLQQFSLCRSTEIGDDCRHSSANSANCD